MRQLTGKQNIMCEHRILFYSHDAYGMGNIRRTLAICEKLSQEIPDLSILIVTGSPVIHALRIPYKVDYVKLPCLSRDEQATFSAKYWDMSTRELIRFRSELISCCIKKFNPNLIVVDKKPFGLNGELLEALTYVKKYPKKTRIILGLRDVLDDPSTTIPIWQKNRYYEAIRDYYDHVWIYGSRKIFDAVKEYQMPDPVARKVIYTGFLRRSRPSVSPNALRTKLGLNGELFVLVMAGGGGDGFPILATYIKGIRDHYGLPHSRSLLISGPEMPTAQRSDIAHCCQADTSLTFLEFSDEIETILLSADVVVSMGGYNAICEILSFRKKAVIIPRVHPVKEQYVRAQVLANMGLIEMIHPADLSKATLFEAIARAAQKRNALFKVEEKIDLNGLERITTLTREILDC
jgi:predicted glycosyltransferase